MLHSLDPEVYRSTKTSKLNQGVKKGKKTCQLLLTDYTSLPCMSIFAIYVN